MSRRNLYIGISTLVKFRVQVPELSSTVGLCKRPINSVKGDPLLDPVPIVSSAPSLLRCAKNSSDRSLVELNQPGHRAKLHTVMLNHV